MQRSYRKMASPQQDRFADAKKDMSVGVILSYVFDWIVLLGFAIIAGVFSLIEPNKRPFSLDDPDISFPMTDPETVPTWLLVVLMAVVPVGIIFVIVLFFVPGATVPANTPATLVWKRKLWELHAAYLGLAMSIVTALFLTQGLKNMFGKPRPDLLARCQPDTSNAEQFAIGGFAINSTLTRLYKAGICTQTDSSILDDGFRSYPSGHSSASSSGLIYLSLFLASKFSVTAPFVLPSGGSNPLAHSAFPSRAQTDVDGHEPMTNGWNDGNTMVSEAQHNARLRSLRRQAAAPPVYLYAISLVPFCLSLWIAASRWYDFGHHGFDIICGYIIGAVPAFYSFHYYHMPIHMGAGWAWGPRSSDRAFWAGVGHLGYVGDSDRSSASADAVKGPVARGTSNDVENRIPPPSNMSRRPVEGAYASGGYSNGGYSNGGYSNGGYSNGNTNGTYQDVELERMNNRI